MTDSSPQPDTTDLRSGAALNDALLAVVALVGRWRGQGQGHVGSTGQDFRYGQEITFAHDGRSFLAYESRTWLLAEDGTTLRPAFRESGFWRPGAGPDDIEVQLATAAGIVEIFEGTAGDNLWELRATGVGMTATARRVAGERRIYAVTPATGSVSDVLSYATELQLPDREPEPHLNGRLQRV